MNLKKSLDKVETGYLRNTPMRNRSMINSSVISTTSNLNNRD